MMCPWFLFWMGSNNTVVFYEGASFLLFDTCLMTDGRSDGRVLFRWRRLSGACADCSDANWRVLLLEWYSIFLFGSPVQRAVPSFSVIGRRVCRNQHFRGGDINVRLMMHLQRCFIKISRHFYLQSWQWLSIFLHTNVPFSVWKAVTTPRKRWVLLPRWLEEVRRKARYPRSPWRRSAFNVTSTAL